MAQYNPMASSGYYGGPVEPEFSSSSESVPVRSPNHLSWTDLLGSYSQETQIRLCRSYASYLSLQRKANQKLNEPEELPPTQPIEEE